MCLTMKKWQQINTGLAQNIYFFFLSLLVFRKNLNNSNWKTKKNLFWNSKIIVVRYFRTMYLYQHFKNRAVSITSDFPHTHNCFDSTLPASLQLKLFISLICNCINPVKTRSDQHLHVKKMIGLLNPRAFDC